MSLSQEVLQQTEYQQLSQDATFSQQLEAFEASLDKNHIQQGLIQELTAELREKLTPEDKEEQLYIKTKEILEDYIDTQKESANEASLASHEKEYATLQHSTQLHIEQAEILKGTSYWYFELTKENTEVFDKIALALGVSDESEETKDKEVKNWCEKIEGIRTSYISWSLDIKLPEATLKSMSNWLSFYFTNWLNTSGFDITKIKTTINTWSIWETVSTMFSLFGEVWSFPKVMNTITGAVEAINNHSSSILIKDVNNNDIINPECAHVFNTPHWFYDWLQWPIASEQLQNKNLSFEEVFTQFQWTSSRQTISENIIAKLNYNDDTHTLMKKVVHEWKSVLDLRNTAKDQIDVVFENIQGAIEGRSSVTGVEGVSDTLELLGFKKIADFICLLLWYGSVDGMEKKYREKQLNKELSWQERKWLDHVISYANKYASSPNYLPQSQDAEGSFLWKTGLKRTIDDYNANNTATINMSIFPSSPDLIVDSFITGFQKGSILPDPLVLQQIPEFLGYVTTTRDPEWKSILSINEDKQEELRKLLQQPAEVAKIVDHIASHQDPAFLASFSEVKSWESAKTPSDYIGLLFTSCIAPTHAANAWKFNAIDRKKLWIWVETWPMMGLWAAKAQELAQATEVKKKEEEIAKTKEEQEKKVKDKQEEIILAKAELATTEEKLAKELVTQKAVDEAKEKVTKLEQELKDLEATNKPAENTAATTENTPIIPTTEETALALANTADTQSSSDKPELKTNKERPKMEKVYEKILLAAMTKYKIINSFAIRAFRGVVRKESHDGRPEDDYKNTSIGRIRSIFWSRMKGLSNEEIAELKKNPTKFRDRVYGPDDPTWMSQKYGNTEIGDGEKYRGRGFNGITFKSNYMKLQKLYEERNPGEKNINIVEHPELLDQPEIAAEFAILYFIDRFQDRPEGGNKDLNAYTDLETAVRDYAQANSGRGSSLESGVKAEWLQRAMDYAKNLPDIV